MYACDLDFELCKLERGLRHEIKEWIEYSYSYFVKETMANYLCLVVNFLSNPTPENKQALYQANEALETSRRTLLSERSRLVERTADPEWWDHYLPKP